VPCARLSWSYRQLLNARKYIVSYSIESFKEDLSYVLGLDIAYRCAKCNHPSFSRSRDVVSAL